MPDNYDSQKLLLQTLRGKKSDQTPVWLMRQAGRYLPEYRELRTQKGGFLELCYDAEAAAEVTIQPIKRFGFDGAILFSDILIVPHAMGQKLWFEAGEGPRLAPRLVDAALSSLEAAPEHFEAIYATVRRVASELDDKTTFMGFAGSPWTVATYMTHGQGSKDQSVTRRYAYQDELAFSELIDAIIDNTVEYLLGQIEAGVDALQLFDSWAGSLSPAQFQKWVIAPNAEIIARLKAVHPDLPIIGFPKGAGAKLIAYANETGASALGLDETVDPVWADKNLPKDLPVQGNLDPLALIVGGEALEKSTAHILKTFAERPHVFNLGHGILPDTPIEHVEKLLTLVRQ
ncbi:uroporphyrinogen decarboxylase [Parasphingorhabdus halotolerans]|uniref:Uroporphyrinogen decarboxylase n=1 Tax=Parasphingorhabdus halotolerans TaxID=2725558 RepID=A0A6H2DPR9_9SPHN|nr:uroporphyrinogen decarboxylase [Parasphingorhabdus halotolerans]QJB69666.1 uroporphyrinogen decarboxylase [Parasphingorhabdus halotolerans]